MNKPRLTLTITTIAALTAPLALAQSASTYTGPKVELTYVHGFTASDRTIKEELIKRFNASHPNIVVKGQAVPWPTTWQQLPSLVSAGRAPDVVAVTEDVMGNFMARGMFVEITPSDLSKAKIKSSDFYKNLWTSSTYKGKLYGVPFSQISFVMFYNKDLLKKSGVTSLPTNRQQFIQAAQKCTTDKTGKRPGDAGFNAKSLNTYGVNVAVGQGNLMAYGILRGNGGDLVNASQDPAFDSPEAQEALQFMVDLVQKYNVSKPNMTAESGIADFRAGKACFNIEGAWLNTQYQGIKDFEYGVAPVPQLGTKRPAFWTAFQSLMLPRQKPNYDNNKRLAALEFARWMTEPAQSLYWTATSGALPIRADVSKSTEYEKSQFAGVAAELEHGYIPTGVPWLPQVMTPWYQSIDSILLGKKNVKDALNAGVTEARKQVQQARQTIR
ncbi:ABC transporter substrate-binding protein [Deinococcus peraridilitoris]|uniref:ABC-type sugar transport system, periplasmic component n=1 Tax=Deinococcus peraridilitoris (strain DSM 19664 / LMG 22246 / CIP 109416 / KR-200) TaxID=937777 RepID=K9ZXF9_DEIPD|nr:ABC transporter substrate-binding protein [Deinococcus peraridilitoris]AFZ66348.1 ABC-type sugar transport system, periplasmic component [Deinococcus peraridilitoris DSM 19664]